MIINDSDLFYTCSLLELIGRVTRQKRGAVVDILGKKVVAHIYASAETLICEPIAHTADEFIEMYRVPQGEFDNLASCKYEIPDYGTIGKVYARLIEDVAREDLIDSLFQVYASEVSDMISDYNTDFYNQARDYIKEYYIANGDPDGIDLRIPDIRFKGFTGEWERRKLGDYLESSTAKNTECTFTIDDVLSVSGDYGVVNQIEFQGRSFAGASVANYGILDVGEVVYTKSPLKASPYGIIKTNKGKTGIVSVLYGVYHPKENLYSDLVQTYFEQNARLNNYLRPLVNKGAKNTLLISDDDALQGNVVFPPEKQEQAKIGQLFANLDALIALHERKCERLQNVKKSMLEKMFPKKGSNVPEIRFAGFTEPWELRKLDSITDVRDGTHDSPQYIAEGHPFVTSKNVKNGYINYDDVQFISEHDFEDINKRSKVDINDILMGMIGTIGNIALVRKEPDFAIKNVALIKDIRSVCVLYLYHCLQSNTIVNQLSENLDGGTQKFIALNRIRTLEIPFPSNDEQKKIGNCMEYLDNLITLHQRELEKLKNIKKSMLEKMFV